MNPEKRAVKLAAYRVAKRERARKALGCRHNEFKSDAEMKVWCAQCGLTDKQIEAQMDAFFAKKKNRPSRHWTSINQAMAEESGQDLGDLRVSYAEMERAGLVEIKRFPSRVPFVMRSRVRSVQPPRPWEVK